MTAFSLPTYSAPASAASGGWALVDRIIRTLTATADGNGTATATALQLDAGLAWSVEHLVCYAGSTAASTFRLYDTTADPVNLLDGTDAGNFGVADWPTGLLVPPSGQLLAVWTGADAGASCRVRLQASVYRTS